jgi:hypothetical protein
MNTTTNHPPSEASAAPCCLDCPAPATHGLIRTKNGRYLGARVPHGARWCQAHGIAAAKRRNAPPAQAGEA